MTDQPFSTIFGSVIPLIRAETGPHVAGGEGTYDPNMDDPEANAFERNVLHYVIWEPTGDPGAGRIVATGFEPEAFVLDKVHTNPNCMVTEGLARLRNDYVDLATKTVRAKQESPVTLDGQMLRNVPPGASVVIDGVPYEAGDSEVELDFDMPGTYRVTVEAPAHLPKTFEVVKP